MYMEYRLKQSFQAHNLDMLLCILFLVSAELLWRMASPELEKAHLGLTLRSVISQVHASRCCVCWY